MTKDDWEELVAQVEDHGPEKVVFYFQPGEEDFMELDVDKISFTDNLIVVELL